MHKSWGNAIEFDEAAERMGVDVMRWLYPAREPEDNILFGWHAADGARRELLVLWNDVCILRHVCAARRLDAGGDASAGPDARAGSLDPVARGRPRRPPSEDRLQRRRRAAAAARLIDAFIDDLSTWYLRLSRRRFSRNGDVADRDAAFATLHAALVAVGRGSSRRSCRSWPSRCTSNLVPSLRRGRARTRVHLTRWPTEELASSATRLEAAMATARRAVDLTPDAARHRPACASASRSPGCGSR